ncbi:MAG: response regulator, partial [Deltaproteobacteria bacterium]|nr:response regulator [Deltaproteobacteria bacterium]
MVKIFFVKKKEITILIVDDEPDAVAVLEELLQDDFNVIPAYGGEEALKILSKEQVGMLLCDQKMPRMTGDELITRTRILYPDT